MTQIFYTKILCLLFVITTSVPRQQLYGQSESKPIAAKLDSLSDTIPALEERIDISVSGVPLNEFIRSIANNVSLNVTIEPTLSGTVANNFSDVKVKDVLLFLCREYNLEIVPIGNILSLRKRQPQSNKPKTPVNTPPDVTYNASQNLLSIDVQNDTLSGVVKRIIDESGENVILAPGLKQQMVSGYIKKMPFDNVLKRFAFANDLEVEKTKDNFYLITKKQTQKTRAAETNQVSQSSQSNTVQKKLEELDASLNFSVRSSDNISIEAFDVPVGDMIRLISDTLSINYVLLSQIQEKTNINVRNITYAEFLTRVLDGTSNTYTKINGIYVIGDDTALSLKTTQVAHLQHRPVNDLAEQIPNELKNTMEIIEFPELNSLFLSGSPIEVEKMEHFLNQIDKVVPVVLIKLIIVDVNKSHTVSTGIDAGLDKNRANSTQKLSPGVDYEIGTKTIDKIFRKLDGFGWVNLGKVSPDFYLHIKAMEDNGILKIRSTPKLSTLNGHEATLSSGQKKYYKEERSNYIGNLNTSLSSTVTWKEVSADLKVTIKPIVSGDEQITLKVEVVQEEFTPREYEEAPPGSVSRNFKSMIRVKNQEMILLGGLDKIKTQNTGQGFPLLSRIPIIKWLFSSKTRSKDDSRLNIFIQPTIIY